MPDGPQLWEAVRRAPHARLRGAVLSYTGYAERAAIPMRRLEVPHAGIPLILSLGPSLLVDGVRHRSFAAGLDDTATVTEYAGEQRGIQVDLTPLGARRLLGVPMSELTRRVVALEDVLGTRATRLVDRLANAASWDERFALLDAVLLGWLDAAPRVAPELHRAWTRLQGSGGAVTVAELAAEVGWSRRHLATRFGADVGMGPKAVARIMRFGRVTQALSAGGGSGLAEIAYACGYADQAHLNRDFRAFAGTTPTAFVARLLPDGAGVAGSEPGGGAHGVARAA